MAARRYTACSPPLAAKNKAGPSRQFTIANCNHPDHPAQIRAPHAYLRWRNADARHPDVLVAQRKERARVHREKGIRWGGRPLETAARSLC